MPILEKLTRPIAIIAIGAAAVLAAPTFASATSMSAEREVSKTGWYGGFKITVDEVTAETESGGTKVDVKLSYENLVGETLTPPDKAYLEVNGGEVVDISFNNKKIAGFGKGKGAATSSLGSTEGDLDEVLDEVALVYGEADGNLTKIPFAAKEKVESIEPRGITVQGTMGEKITVGLEKAFLWPSYKAGEEGKYELWVEFNAEAKSGFSCYCPLSEFSLSAPDGKSVAADSRSPWTGAAIGGNQNVTGAWMIFVIDEPAEGDYTFTFSPEEQAKDSTTITL